jgi:hypothetical protein
VLELVPAPPEVAAALVDPDDDDEDPQALIPSARAPVTASAASKREGITFIS